MRDLALLTWHQWLPVDGGVADGYDGWISEIFSAVGQTVAVKRAESPAGFLEDALGRAGVPFHCRDEARIKIGRTFSDEAEFKRTAHVHQLGAREFLEHGGDSRPGVIAAGHDTKPGLVGFRDMDRHRLRLANPLEGAITPAREVFQVGCRGEHDAKGGLAGRYDYDVFGSLDYHPKRELY